TLLVGCYSDARSPPEISSLSLHDALPIYADRAHVYGARHARNRLTRCIEDGFVVLDRRVSAVRVQVGGSVQLGTHGLDCLVGVASKEIVARVVVPHERCAHGREGCRGRDAREGEHHEDRERQCESVSVSCWHDRPHGAEGGMTTSALTLLDSEGVQSCAAMVYSSDWPRSTDRSVYR